MALFDYIRSRDTADRLLTRYGTTGKLRQLPVSTGWDASTANPKDYSIKLLMSDYTDHDRQSTLILQGDRKMMFSAKGLNATPKMGDQIIVDGENVPYAIVNLNTLQPAGTAVVYTAQVRR